MMFVIPEHAFLYKPKIGRQITIYTALEVVQSTTEGNVLIYAEEELQNTVLAQE